MAHKDVIVGRVPELNYSSFFKGIIALPISRKFITDPVDIELYVWYS